MEDALLFGMRGNKKCMIARQSQEFLVFDRGLCLAKGAHALEASCRELLWRCTAYGFHEIVVLYGRLKECVHDWHGWKALGCECPGDADQVS